MVKKYLTELEELLEKVVSPTAKVEYKHFFSGAAAYSNKKIFATLTPKGFAIKLPEENVKKLVKEKQAKLLHYFPKSPVKKNYAVLSKQILEDKKELKQWIKISLQYVKKV